MVFSNIKKMKIKLEIIHKTEYEGKMFNKIITY